MTTFKVSVEDINVSPINKELFLLEFWAYDEELLEQIDVDSVVEHYGADNLLNEINIEDVRVFLENKLQAEI
jgi:hypothetical protein